MRQFKPAFLTTTLLLGLGTAANAHERCPQDSSYSLAMHGGAGVITKDNMSDELEAEYRAVITEVLNKGDTMLAGGEHGLDVVVALIKILEDDPKFNAGKGAVFAADGKNYMDASIMDGQFKNSGAVSSVTTIKNPITLARAVMDKSRHVMLSGEGAETFATENDIEIVDPAYFFTQRRYDSLQRKLRDREGYNTPETRFGTVGIVVKDSCGDLAAGTSTGGLTAKEFGRVGDTPIIGAGTYADNDSCAVSATGTGEFFIRATVASDICARMKYSGVSLQEAADTVMHDVLPAMSGSGELSQTQGGDGGIVAVDKDGNWAFSFNTEGMYRGALKKGDTPVVQIFKDK